MKKKCKLIGEEEILVRINKEIAKNGLKIVRSNPEDIDEYLECGRLYLTNSSGAIVEDEVDIVDMFEELSLAGPDEEVDFAGMIKGELLETQEVALKVYNEFPDEDEI